MVPPRIVYASQIDVTERSDPPRGYQGLHGFRNRALERRVLVGMLGKQPSRVCPVLAHLRHGRPAMGRNDRLQPSAVCTASTALSTLSSPSVISGRSRTA